ncbi:hypothetical protein Droror1_Dr00021568 [Drosera rotundifolia]
MSLSLAAFLFQYGLFLSIPFFPISRNLGWSGVTVRLSSYAFCGDNCLLFSLSIAFPRLLQELKELIHDFESLMINISELELLRQCYSDALSWELSQSELLES